MTIEKQVWHVSREVRLGELVALVLFAIAALGIVRKSELRFVGLETATRANSVAIGQLTTAVDKLAGTQTDQHDWILKHEAVR